jgi:hypothetical protein
MSSRSRERTFSRMHDTPIAYDPQAQDEGEYVLEERTRDYIRNRPRERADGPSENAD